MLSHLSICHVLLECTWDLVVDNSVAAEEVKRRLVWWGIVDHGVEGTGIKSFLGGIRVVGWGRGVLWC